MAECTGYIKVKKMGGASVELPIDATTTVAQIKADLAAELEIPVPQQKLLLKGKPLADEKDLADYGIADGSALTLVAIKAKKKKGPGAGNTAQRSAPAVQVGVGDGGASDVALGRSKTAPARAAQSAEAGATAQRQAAACRDSLDEAASALAASGAAPASLDGQDVEHQLAAMLQHIDGQLDKRVASLLSDAEMALDAQDSVEVAADADALEEAAQPLHNIGMGLRHTAAALGYAVGTLKA